MREGIEYISWDHQFTVCQMMHSKEFLKQCNIETPLDLKNAAIFALEAFKSRSDASSYAYGPIVVTATFDIEGRRTGAWISFSAPVCFEEL